MWITTVLSSPKDFSRDSAGIFTPYVVYLLPRSMSSRRKSTRMVQAPFFQPTILCGWNLSGSPSSSATPFTFLANNIRTCYSGNFEAEIVRLEVICDLNYDVLRGGAERGFGDNVIKISN